VRIVNVKEDAVMARAGLGLEAMVENGMDAELAAKPEHAQRIARLQSHGRKTAIDRVGGHQAGGGGHAAIKVSLRDARPNLPLGDLLVQRAVDHGKARCAAGVRGRLGGLPFVRDG
jgi:hypothetical protein